MRSATSYFKLSKAIVKEDIRRFWALPVLTFVAYFIFGPFRILIDYKDLESNRYYMVSMVDDLVCGQDIFFHLILFVSAMLMTLLIFSYLHEPGSVMSVHSQPFTRSELLNSHALSAAICTFVPLYLNGLVMMIIAKPLYYSSADIMSYTEQAVNVFSRIGILRMLGDFTIAGLIVIFVTVIAGMATGVALHHSLAAIAFNVAPISCVALFTLYCDTYLYGFSISDVFNDFMMHLQPSIALVYIDKHYSASEVIFYLVALVVLFALAHFAYAKRPLEKATDGVVFGGVTVFIVLLSGYVGMTCLGFLFREMSDKNEMLTILGFVLGAVLGMIVSLMIILKSIRIINNKTMKIAGCYIVVAALLVVFIGFDATGYEKRTLKDPDAVRFGFNMYELGRVVGYDDILYYEPETIGYIEGIRNYMLEHKDEILAESGNDEGFYQAMTAVDFEYLKGQVSGEILSTEGESDSGADKSEYKKSLRRNYTMVPVSALLKCEDFLKLLESDEYRAASLDSIPDEQIRTITIAFSEHLVGGKKGDSSENIIVKDEDKAKIIEALKKDIKEYKASELISYIDKPKAVTMIIEYAYSTSVSDFYVTSKTVEPIDDISPSDSSVTAPETYNTFQTEIAVPECFRNTLACLESLGFDTVTFNKEFCDYAVAIPADRLTDAEERDLYDRNIDGQREQFMTEVRELGGKVYNNQADIELLFGLTKAKVLYGTDTDVSAAGSDLTRVLFLKFDDNGGSEYMSLVFNGYAKTAELP